MPPITVYTAMYCPYCSMAKQLLDQKGARYEEIDVTGKADLRARMRERANGRNTVPQIFIGDTHVGGCDDLFAMDQAGTLDPLLAG